MKEIFIFDYEVPINNGKIGKVKPLTKDPLSDYSGTITIKELHNLIKRFISDNIVPLLKKSQSAKSFVRVKYQNNQKHNKSCIELKLTNTVLL